MDNNYVGSVPLIEIELPGGARGLKGDQGPKGDKGDNYNPIIEEVETLEPTQPATAEVRADDNNIYFSFGIPKGDPGMGTKLSDFDNDVGFVTADTTELENYALISNTYTKTEVDNSLSSKANTSDVNTALATKVNTSDVIDNLTSTETAKPLSAKQGKILKDTLDEQEEKVNKKPYVFNNVASMKADNTLADGMTVQTLGYYEKNDGGNALYYITDDNLNADDITIIELNSGLKAKLIINNVNVKQFGAYGDGEHDDSDAIQKAIDYSYDNNFFEVYLPNGVYNISKPLFLYDKMKIYGNNSNSSIIQKITNTKSKKIGLERDAIIILTNRNFDSTKQSQQQAIDNLYLKGNITSYVENKSTEDCQYAIVSIAYSPKVKITNFLITNVDYGIYSPAIYTGLIQNCPWLSAYYGAIASYAESQGLNIQNINTGNTNVFGIKLSGGSYSTLSNILIEWNNHNTCFDLQYWSGELVNCGAELGTIGFDTFLYLVNSKVSLSSGYMNTERNNDNMIMFNLNNSVLKIQNCSLGYSKFTNDYTGTFANITNRSTLIVGQGVSSPSKFLKGVTRSGDNNTLIINDTKIDLTSMNEILSIAGPSNRYEGSPLTYLNQKLLNKDIPAHSIYNGFISTPENNGRDISYYDSFKKGDIGIFNNPTSNGCAMWFCNKDNNNSKIVPQTIGTISEISNNTIVMTDCRIENYLTNGYRLFKDCTVRGVNSGTTKMLSWVNYQTNTLIFYSTTDLNNFEIGEKLEIVNTIFIRSGDFLYIPIINSGYSIQRPTQNLVNGTMFFDITLNKPIWYNNGHWYDATGTIV